MELVCGSFCNKKLFILFPIHQISIVTDLQKSPLNLCLRLGVLYVFVTKIVSHSHLLALNDLGKKTSLFLLSVTSLSSESSLRSQMIQLWWFISLPVLLVLFFFMVNQCFIFFLPTDSPTLRQTKPTNQTKKQQKKTTNQPQKMTTTITKKSWFLSFYIITYYRNLRQRRQPADVDNAVLAYSSQ